MRKKLILFMIFLFFSFFLVQVYAQTRPDDKLFQDAKILIFDEQWEKAQKKLEELLEKYPQSRWFSQAFFYRAKCLDEQKGKEVEALKTYQEYLKLKKKNKELAEEAEISIMELAFKLYEKGRRPYLEEIEKRIVSSNKVIRYFAAFKLSYIRDGKIAARGVPVLKQIVEKEKDDELRDRAKIALLRVDPDALKDIEERTHQRRARVLKIEVYNKIKRRTEISLAVPWALADLVLGAISEEDKLIIRKKGYDLDKIIKELRELKMDIIKFESDEKLIKIWIE